MARAQTRNGSSHGCCSKGSGIGGRSTSSGCNAGSCRSTYSGLGSRRVGSGCSVLVRGTSGFGSCCSRDSLGVGKGLRATNGLFIRAEGDGHDVSDVGATAPAALAQTTGTLSWGTRWRIR